MANPESAKDPDEVRFIIDGNYIAFVLGIVLLTIVNSVLWLLLRQQQEQSVLLIINSLLSVFLLADAFVSLRRWPKPLAYFFRHYGWMTFLGSLPIPFFGVFRLLRIGLGIRRLRRADVDEARRFIITKRAKTTLLFVVITAIVVYEIAVLSILSVESTAPSGNIQTGGDALWWGLVTISTVGYGDQFPVTTGGRLIGIALIAVGVGLFTSITSFMADWFRQSRVSKSAEALSRATGRTRSTLEMVEDLRQALDLQEKSHQENLSAMQAQLDALEDRLRKEIEKN